MDSLNDFYVDQSSTCFEVFGFVTDTNIQNTSILRQVTSAKCIDLASHKIVDMNVGLYEKHEAGLILLCPNEASLRKRQRGLYRDLG